MTEFTRRINFVVKVLSAGGTHLEAKQALVKKYNISERQAFRYLKSAGNISEPLAVPEEKLVFTVKLPISLIQQIRERADNSNLSLSCLVTEALETFLKTGGESGTEKRRTHS